MSRMILSGLILCCVFTAGCEKTEYDRCVDAVKEKKAQCYADGPRDMGYGVKELGYTLRCDNRERDGLEACEHLKE